VTRPEPHPSLRAEQVAQTRAALVAAGRLLFGRNGFAATSVEDLAREARVTTGALYHHFATKAELFEAVFISAHAALLEASIEAGTGADSEIEFLARGFDAFLDAILDPELAQILVVDAPAVLGLVRFTELDELVAFGGISMTLRGAAEAGRIRAEDPDTLTRLLLGALTRGSMLIASSPEPQVTRAAVSQAVRSLLAALVVSPPSQSRSRTSRRRAQS
jgi:AcrR family transcriptional regulator